MKNTLRDLMEKEIAQYKISDITLKGDSELLSKIKEMSKNKALFIFRFGDTSCDLCVENAFIELSNYQKFSNNKQFLIITHFQDLRRFRAISNLYKGKYYLINIEYSTNLYIEHKEESLPPVFFVIDQGDIKPKKVFFFLKELPEINKKYFDLISSTYFDN
jgi:hypothetical protein